MQNLIIILSILAIQAQLLAQTRATISASESTSYDSCNAKLVGDDQEKKICVCSEKACSSLQFEWPDKSGQASWVQSSRSGKRFEISSFNDESQSQSQSNGRPTDTHIRINLNEEHQSILGWGGAFTDAFGYNLHNLTRNLADKLIESYYGENGLQYNMGRVPIGGSDFSTRPYSYDDTERPDFALVNWTLAEEDHLFKIPVIKRAIELTSKSGNVLKLFGSPWSPPRWMKTSNSLIRGFLIDEDRIYESYANYLVKFYDTYASHGINFWGATVQNEPMIALLPEYYFNSMQFANTQMVKFIGKFLGPALVASGRSKDKFKLMVGDDNLGWVNFQVPEVLNDPEVQKYVAGFAFHWYTSNTSIPYDALDFVQNQVKDKVEFTLMTEACTGSGPRDLHVDLGSWERGEMYANDIIEDLARGTAGWIDWNMALDQQGGPNWVSNFVDSPIIVNAKAGEFYKQPMYYALAHFSRFFKPGSVRVAASSKSTLHRYGSLTTIAVHNKETGHLIINVLNKLAEKQTVDISIQGGQNSTIGDYKLRPFTLDGKSINSFVLKL